MRIIWTEDNDLIPHAGHGVDFFAGNDEQSSQLVAVIRGLEWLHGEPETVEVRIRSAADPIEAVLLMQARTIIEDCLLHGKAFDRHLSPSFYVHING